MRINAGCGRSPTKGWRNFDNSLSIRLAKVPFLAKAMRAIGMLNAKQFEFIEFARTHDIEYGNAKKRLPVPAGSAEAFYCCHMLEHFDRNEAAMFLQEVKRVLRPGGVLRIAVPDIRQRVGQYLERKDADEFIERTQLAHEIPAGFLKPLYHMYFLSPDHRWMYDGDSLCRLLTRNGFVNVSVVQPGETRIPNPEPLNLFERADDSVYVEGEAPKVELRADDRRYFGAAVRFLSVNDGGEEETVGVDRVRVGLLRNRALDRLEYEQAYDG